ncbi:hypothetical protein BOX15_Mlig021329g1 [Macrostomum lignano]|uniref:Membrane-associated protein n=1 Tax=Macrostomum lignano TaxID=282301 RepID=A0A267GRS1_9PLAT|nr:hypothetical protein BOX15_Mlig021329g1 [Macrostomum lignano]
MLLSLFLLHLLSSSMISATPVRPSSAASNRVTGCQLPGSKVGNYFSSAMNSSDTWFSLEIGYVRLTMLCVSNEFGDEVQSGTGISAVLSSSGASGQVWPVPPKVFLANVKFALAMLRGLLPQSAKHPAVGSRLTQLSMAGLGNLPANAIAQLATTLTKFGDLSTLNISSVGANILPSELLSLPRLRRLDAGGNPLDCGLIENRWLRLLTQLGSRLVEPALLMQHCIEENATNSSAAELYRMDSQLATNITELEAVENDSAASHYVDLHGEISVPCSRRYFRPTDDGIWTPDASVVWRRLDQPGAELLLASMGNLTTYLEANSTAHLSSSARVWHPEWHRKQFATQVDIGSAALGAPLMIRGARLAVAGLWRCELAKAGLVLGVRHRIVLRPPFETLEIACYIVAASSSMAMVLIGLAAGLIRIFIRTRCCTRVVHIVEAQSVHNLNASPLQTRRRRQEAADAVVGLDLTAEGGDIEESDMGAVEPWLDGLNPSSSGVGANIRDRMRDINDQLRLRVTNMRAGWTSGVEHVKGQMRSMAEFCGVNNPPLDQTVSVVSVYTDPDGRQEPMEQHLHLLSSV